MPDLDCIRPREQLTRYPGTPLNFLIYRLTYKDDTQWDRFMEFFKRITHDGLERSGDADLIPHVAWDVHSDHKLDGATSTDVYHLLNKRIKTITTVKRYDDRFYESKGKNDDSLSIPRNTAAIAVDQKCIDSVLRYMDGDGGEPPRHMEWAFVELVSLYEEEMPKLVCLSVVFPHVYSIVEAFGWDMFKQDGIYDG